MTVDHSKAVFRHGVRPKGWKITGYGPLPGWPRDENGALILRYTYGPPKGFADIQPVATPVVESGSADQASKPRKVARGVQGTLI